jgi:hypothetical protein
MPTNANNVLKKVIKYKFEDVQADNPTPKRLLSQKRQPAKALGRCHRYLLATCLENMEVSMAHFHLLSRG